MPRTKTSEAMPSLVTLPERVSVLETKVDNIEEKIVDLKVDIKDMHDCLDRTRDEIKGQLQDMLVEYRSNRDNYYAHASKLHEEDQLQHTLLAGKIADLERQKHKFTLYAMLGLAFAAGAGWVGHTDIKLLFKFLGL